MNVKGWNSWLMFIYCLLLFSAGGVFGFVFSSSGQISFIAFLGALSSLATVGAAVTAVIALSSWKAQFNLQKKYDALIDVRTYLHGAAEPCIYLMSLKDCFCDYLRTSNDSVLVESYPHEVQRKWFNYIIEFNKSWDVLSVLLTKEELLFFSSNPAALNDHVRRTKDEMSKIAFSDKSEDGERYKRIMNLSEFSRESALEIERSFLELEVESRNLLKALAG